MIDIYKDSIVKYIDKNCINNNLIENKLEVISTNGEVTLILEIYTKTHKIKNANYIANVDDFMRGILNAFCSIIVNLPIIEASDHSVLKLEYLLRDMSKKPVNGIITPNNTLKEFLIIQTLIRDCFKQYKEKILNVPENNSYLTPLTKELEESNYEIKKEKLSKVVDSYLKNVYQNNCDYAISIINARRIEFIIYNQNLKNVGHFLLELEKYIQKVLQVPIEVMYTEKIDTNRVRQKSRK